VYLPTLTGLGKKSHLISPDISLETHIHDVVNEILWEDLQDVVLVGHSYGGMVITGVADSIPGRLRRMIYVDAVLPLSGEYAFSQLPGFRALIDNNTRNGLVIPSWEPTDKPLPKDVPHPLKTLTDVLVLDGRSEGVPAGYLLTEEPSVQPDDFKVFAERAATRGWPVVTMESDHAPERTHVSEVARILIEMSR
jgi:pimeloyl-ACP methyl ester carboxylesterase